MYLIMGKAGQGKSRVVVERAKEHLAKGENVHIITEEPDRHIQLINELGITEKNFLLLTTVTNLPKLFITLMEDDFSNTVMIDSSGATRGNMQDTLNLIKMVANHKGKRNVYVTVQVNNNDHMDSVKVMPYEDAIQISRPMYG